MIPRAHDAARPSHRRVAMLGALFASLTAVGPAAAQAPDEPAALRDRKVEGWSRELPNTPVLRIAQDPTGYLLLATNAGLGRFDGVRFSFHQPSAVSSGDSLPDSYLTDLIVAHDGAKWISTMHGGVVEYRDGRFRTYGAADGLTDLYVHTVFEDSRGTIWAGSGAGVAKLANGRFIRLSSREHLTAHCFAEGANGAIWVGTDFGLWQVKDSALSPLPLPTLRNARIVRIRRTRDGHYWVGTTEGLLELTQDARGDLRVLRSYSTRDGLKTNYINGIAEQADGTVWVAMFGGGVAARRRDGRFESLGTREGIADLNVYDIAVDREGDVWVGTADGLTRIRSQRLRTWSSRERWSTTFLWSVRVDATGVVWIGTDGDGLVRMAPDGTSQQFRVAQGLPADAVLGTYRARDGTMWAGTKLGIARWTGSGFVNETTNLGLAPIGVRTMFEDTRGRFWVGTDTSLMMGTPAHVTNVPRTADVTGGRVYDVVEDARGRIWVASGTLSYFDRDSVRVFRTAAGDTVANTMDVYADTVGLWVATYTGGLALVRHDSLFRLPPQWTTGISQMLKITDDGTGVLWITSGDGLLRVRKDALLSWIEKNPQHVPLRLFTKDDGLRSHDFAMAGSSSGGRAPDGRLWFPTTSGLVVVDPRSVRISPLVPTVIIERVIVDGTAMAATPTVELPRGALAVSVEFTSPMLSLGRRTRLWYRLEGVDTAWRSIDGALDRRAVYERLPRGTFKFSVRAQSADGVPVEHAASIFLVSRPPLSGSPWFWIIVAFAVATAGTSAYRWRTASLRRRANTLQRLLKERTESLEARERLEQELLHAHKLESVGRLAGGVAHDLNNLLTSILGNTDMALSDPDLPPSVRGDLGEVRSGTLRAATLTKQLLTFARKQKVQPRLVRARDLVSNVDGLVRRLLPENVRYTSEHGDDDWVVNVDLSQMEQVLVNLVLNARDAMPSGGAITVRTSVRSVDLDAARQSAGLTPGEYVVIAVADTGSGMSADVLAHLFEPFYTTKDVGKGTGLGLATAFGIVTQAGGHISVQSTVGTGSSFEVFLPREAGRAVSDLPTTTENVPNGTERVLVVEDEAAVRNVAERALRALGYTVVAAADGLEALEFIEASTPPFDLVLSDVRMPRLDGIALAETVRVRWPELRVALMSGHAEALLLESGIGSTSPVLRKPFSASELGRWVREVLDGRVGA